MTRVGNYYTPNERAVDTTSRSKTWSRGLSPFFLGPCKLYAGFISKNVENGWQYSKVYPQHVGPDGNPTADYFAWAREGWGCDRAVRYPFGRGVIPSYSYWDGEKLDYVAARKRIYIPLYSDAVRDTEAFATLRKLIAARPDVILKDFDGYDHVKVGKSLRQVVNDPSRKMGHAFVLAMMLDDRIEECVA